jgi:hypothetical protein
VINWEAMSCHTSSLDVPPLHISTLLPRHPVLLLVDPVASLSVI